MRVKTWDLTFEDKSTVRVEHYCCPEAQPVRAKGILALRYSDSKPCDQREGSQHNRRNASRHVFTAGLRKGTHGELVEVELCQVEDLVLEEKKGMENSGGSRCSDQTEKLCIGRCMVRINPDVEHGNSEEGLR